jgi:hypothetical protein
VDRDELLLRNEIAFRELRAFLAEQTLALQGLTQGVERMGRSLEVLGRKTDQVIAQLRTQRQEFVAEMQAQRQALLRVLDHLDGKADRGPGAA